MDGNAELKQLTELLRIGLKAVRDIAKHRPRDHNCLIDISNRSEKMADELDALIARHDREENLQ